VISFWIRGEMRRISTAAISPAPSHRSTSFSETIPMM